MALRIACVVPGCRRTMARVIDDDEEVFCQRHYNQIPNHLLRDYENAWHAAVAADRQGGVEGGVDPQVYVRVTELFQKCKAHFGILP